MHFVILAQLSTTPNDLEKRVVNPVVGYVLVAGARVGMTPDQIVNRALVEPNTFPSRVRQAQRGRSSVLHALARPRCA